MRLKFKFSSDQFVVILLLIISSCGTNESNSKIEQKYLIGELPVQEGMVVFNQNCASCHNFNSAEIGPNLAGITSKMDKEWIKAFIQNPQKMIQKGDERALAKFEKFGVYMPAFDHLEEKDLENLLAFIHKFSEGEKKNTSNRKGALINPITKPIPESNVNLVVEEFTTIPSSSPTPPDTRINTLRTQGKGKLERLFISDLRGTLFEIIGQKPHPYLIISEFIQEFIDAPGLGSGLGSFAFHPDFETNGLLYTTHTEPSKTKKADFAVSSEVKSRLQWVLSEWKTKTPTAPTFKGQQRELMRVDMVTQIHGFQELTFNPNAKPNTPDYGLLYLGIGDGGAALAGHPELCGTKNRIWGSVIRIDPKGSNSENGKYGIPESNPFANKEGLGEIFCYGFRNPHRISWEQGGAQKLLISNIGQHSIEEVNLGSKGAHFGWPFREGSYVFDVNANPELVYTPTDKEREAIFQDPVIQYDHDEGNAVSGGFVYTNDQIPSLKGNYLFGDIARGTLFLTPLVEIEKGKQASIQKIGLELNGEKTSFISIRPNERVDLRFGQDSGGELYLFTKSNGKVYRVIDFRESEK
jgi:glucose/arabinose dehydrogenase/cytochrome c2